MKKALFAVAIAGLLTAVFSQPAAAGDLSAPAEGYTYNGYEGAPDWSSNPYFTHQSWDIVPVPDPDEPGTYKECVTYDNDNPLPFPDPLAPDAATYGGPGWHNPYGTPRYYATGWTGGEHHAWTACEDYAMGTEPTPGCPNTPYGVAGGMGGGWAAFEIPNISVPDHVKEVWVQYIVYLFMDDDPGKMITKFFVDHDRTEEIGTMVDRQWESVEGAGSTGKWWRVTEEWTIGEQSETVYFYVETPFDTKVASLIDSIDIVTRCVEYIPPPEVENTSPENGAAGVKVDSVISVTFSKPMDKQATGGAFSISPAVDGVLSWQNLDRTMIFTPQSYLSCGTGYSVTISTVAAEAVAGVNLKEDYTFAFTSEPYTAPDPEFDGMPEGTVNTDEATITVGGAGVYRYRYCLVDSEWSDPFALSDPLVLSGLSDGGHTLYVQVEDAIMTWHELDSFAWTVAVQPSIVTTSPGDGQNAPISTVISVVFSEAMNIDSVENAFIIEPYVAGTFTWSENTMTFTPGGDLTPDITYTVTINISAKDLAGNALESPCSWSFETFAGAAEIRCRVDADTYVLTASMGGGPGKPCKYRLMAAACPIVNSRILVRFDLSELEAFDSSQIVKAEVHYYMLENEPQNPMSLEPPAPEGTPMYGFIYPSNTTTYEYTEVGGQDPVTHPDEDEFWFEVQGQAPNFSDLTHTWRKTKPGYVPGGPMIFATHTTGPFARGSIDITEIVKGWIRSDYPNNGMELKDHDDRSYVDAEHEEGFPWYWASKENDDSSKHPYLLVEVDANRLRITDKPSALPDLAPGQYMAFGAAGGAGSYTWQAAGPDGSSVTAQVLDTTTGSSTTFTAPATAGLYKIIVSDGIRTDSIRVGVSDPFSYRPDDELYELSQSLFPLFMGEEISQADQQSIYEICEKIVDDIGSSGMLGKIAVHDMVVGGTGKSHAASATIGIIQNPDQANQEISVTDENGNMVCKIEIGEGDIDPGAGNKIYAVATDTGISSWGDASGVYSFALYNENGEKLDNSLINNIVITMSFNTDMIVSDQLRDGTYSILYTEDTGTFFTSEKEDPKNSVPVTDIIDVDYKEGWIKFRMDHLSSFGIQPAGSGGFTSSGEEGDISAGGGCFIATAAYGSIFEPHVKILREFRDRYLLNNTFGKEFVNLYYTYSPPIADIIVRHEALRALVRVGLLPFVGASYSMLHFGPVLTLGVFLLFAATAFYFRKRKK